MPLSTTNPYQVPEPASNAAGPGAAFDNPVARRLLATRALIQNNAPQTLPEFQAARERTANQFGANAQTTQNALERRFAAMGNLNSGEATKQLALAGQANSEQANQAQQEINAQEQQQVGAQRDQLMQQAIQQEALDNDNALKKQSFELDRATKLGSLDLAKQQFSRESLENAINAALAYGESGDQDAYQREIGKFLNLFGPYSGGQFGGKLTSSLPPIVGGNAPKAPGSSGIPSIPGLPPLLPNPGPGPASSEGTPDYSFGGFDYKKMANGEVWRRQAGSTQPYVKF